MTPAGSKSVDCCTGTPVCWVAGKSPEWEVVKFSEEHMTIDVAGGTPPVRGDVCWLITRHICCTINLADQVLLVDDGQVSIAQVAARGHDMFLEGPPVTPAKL